MSKEEDRWQSQFGDEYTDRNPQTVEAMDRVQSAKKGISRTAFTRAFFTELEKPLKLRKTLEIGCNVGVVLQILSDLGFENLYGIDVNQRAIDVAKQETVDKDIYVIKGSAFDVPFKDAFFDLVYCNGLLIHIAPDDVGYVLDEMHRCSSKYIWCYENYSDSYEMVLWRGEKDMLWKTNFAKLFVDRFSDLKLVKEERIPYVGHPELVDSMFLLEKVGCHK